MLLSYDKLLNISLLWTASSFFPGFYFTRDLGDIQALSCIALTFSCDEYLESTIWVTISHICRACKRWTNMRGSSRETEECAFALGKCLQRSILLESYLSYEIGYQTLSCSFQPTWSPKTTWNEQQTNQHKTNKPFTEVSVSTLRQFCLCTGNPAPSINKYPSIIILFWVTTKVCIICRVKKNAW